MAQQSGFFTKQDPMRRMLYALTPIGLWSIWLYGWRTVAVAAVVFLLGILTEFVMEQTRHKKVSEAVLVTCALLSLSLPPAVPLWVAAVGSVFAVLFGKEVYGGFGRNIFNPAITGRVFIYVSFPLLMQTTWMLPGNFGTGGVSLSPNVLGSTWLEAIVVILIVAGLFWLLTRRPGNKRWLIFGSVTAVVLMVLFYVISAYGGFRSASAPWLELDAVSGATPLELLRKPLSDSQLNLKPGYGYLADNSLLNLFFGFRMGSIGEGGIWLIVLAAIYLLVTRTANWRLVVSTLGGAVLFSAIFYFSGLMKTHLPQLDPTGKDWLSQLSDLLKFLMAGSLLFCTVFMATDPVSAPKKVPSQFLFGLIIGGVTITVRCFSGFPEGISFGLLTGNTFACLLDEMMPERRPKTAVSATTPAAVGATSPADAAPGGQS